MQMRWIHAMPLMLPLLTGCALRAPEACSFSGTSPMLVTELFFGRGDVTDAAWASFAADTLTKHFPDGFTVLDGVGQWRQAPGQPIAREGSKLVIIAAPDTETTREHLRDVITAYRAATGQKSVGLILETKCASF